MSDVYYGFFDVDLAPPVLSNRFPANGASNQLVTTNVSFDLTDSGSGLNTASIYVTIDGQPVISAGAFQSGYTGSIVTVLNVTTVTINPNSDFAYSDSITVVVNAADNTSPTPNAMVPETWTFQTESAGSPPHIENNAPTGLYRPVTEHIRFDLIDATLPAPSLASVVIRVLGATVWQNQLPQNGYTVVVTPILDGYHYDVAAPVDWTPGAVITVEVDATDSITAMPTVSWAFTVTTVGLAKCSPAPLLPVEIRLRSPFMTPALEELRRHVLTVISHSPRLDPRIRGVLLMANFNDFRPVFKDVLAIPASILLETICGQRKLFDIYRDLQPFQSRMQRATSELQRLGLSQGYVELIATRTYSHSPQQVIGAACAILLFGSLLQPDS